MEARRARREHQGRVNAEPPPRASRTGLHTRSHEHTARETTARRDERGERVLLHRTGMVYALARMASTGAAGTPRLRHAAIREMRATAAATIRCAETRHNDAACARAVEIAFAPP